MNRKDNRAPTELRPLSFDLHFIPYAEGSCLVNLGMTRVLCNVSIEDGVPSWMKSQGVTGGWLTAEYAM
ncbi:MAG: ribonuclease PH, partial [Bdellovibrionales bacterium]|nr:ribonuclease PH [Bdellovibrionales bacterium]